MKVTKSKSKNTTESHKQLNGKSKNGADSFDSLFNHGRLSVNIPPANGCFNYRFPSTPISNQSFYCLVPNVDYLPTAIWRCWINTILSMAHGLVQGLYISHSLGVGYCYYLILRLKNCSDDVIFRIFLDIERKNSRIKNFRLLEIE